MPKAGRTKERHWDYENPGAQRRVPVGLGFTTLRRICPIPVGAMGIQQRSLPHRMKT